MKESTLKPLLIVFYCVGLIGFLLPVSSAYFKQLTPFTLLMNAGLVLAYQRHWNVNTVLAMSFVTLAGFGVEWLGIQTGLIFGQYTYGTVLGPKIGGTALIIGVNWLLLVMGSFYLLAPLRMNLWIKNLLGALLMLGYDWVLEPVAMRLGMWHWETGRIPVQNYLAWFALGLLFQYIFSRYAKRGRNTLAGYIFLVQLVFFLLLRTAIELGLL